jgi:DNA-binding response OmpR family regulator
MRILIIDDDEQIRELLCKIMELQGFEVMEAENGRVGMQQHRQNPADLIITDLIMPEQEGLETISTMRREYGNVKIIAISGGGQMGPEAYLPAALELGADRVFSKPFDLKEMVHTVKELLEHE